MGTYETETSLVARLNERNLLEDEAGVPAGLRPELSVIGFPRINSMASTVVTIRYP